MKAVFVNLIKNKGLKHFEDQSLYDHYINIYRNKLNTSFNCNFFTDKSIDVKLKRDVIECIERTLAMNIQKLPLPNRIKITQEIETVVPKIEIETVIKLREVNPLYFEIYQKSLKVSDKNSLLPKSVSNIINYLNNKYVKLIQQNKLIKQRTFINKKGIVENSYDCKVDNGDKRKDNGDKTICKILDGLKLISTFKFLMFFINETNNLLKYDFFNDRKLIGNDIDIIKSLAFNLEYYSGGWSDNQKFETIKEYTYYLINNLNLFIEILDIKLEEEKKKEEKKDFDQYLSKYKISKKWYNENKEFVNFVNNRVSFWVHYYLNSDWTYYKFTQEIRRIVFEKYNDVDSDNLNNLINMFVKIIEESKEEEKKGEEKSGFQKMYENKTKDLKKEDYDYEKYRISKTVFDAAFEEMITHYMYFKRILNGSGRKSFIDSYMNDSDDDSPDNIELWIGNFYDMFENPKQKKDENKEVDKLATRLYVYIKSNPKFDTVSLESFTTTLYHVIKEIQNIEKNESKNIEKVSKLDYLQYLKNLSKDDLTLLVAKDEDIIENISNGNYKSYSDIPKDLLEHLLFRKKFPKEELEYKEYKESKETKNETKRETKRENKNEETKRVDPLSFESLPGLYQYLDRLTREELFDLIDNQPTDYFNFIHNNTTKRLIIDKIADWWTKESENSSFN